jgi:ABC-type multidrug transport system fused ATPase/permease subunit
MIEGALAVMLALEWRLTVIGMAVLPLFFVARKLGATLHKIAARRWNTMRR